MTQSNTFSPRGLKYLLNLTMKMTIEVPQNKKISEEGKKELVLSTVKEHIGKHKLKIKRARERYLVRC